MAEEISEKTDDQVQNEAEDTSRQDLIDRTQARLDKVAGIESDENVSDEKPEDEDKPKNEDESKDEDEKPTDESVDESEDEDKSEETAEVDDKKSTEPTLPDAYRRSLKAYDWTDEEITQAFEAAPDKFLETAERIHRNRNVETAGYAEVGRRARQQQQAGVTVTDGKSEVPQVVKTVDAEALTKEYGNEELVNAIVSPVNEVIQQVNAILPQLEQSKKDAEQSRVEVLGQQIETFFTAKGLKPYTEVYGDKTKTALTEVQNQNRNKVLEQADAIIIGAKLQGRQLTVEEGLLMAHDSVASEFKEQVIRKDLKTKTKKRAKSVSVKPSHHGKSPTDGKPTTRKQLETKVATGLKAIFGS